MRAHPWFPPAAIATGVRHTPLTQRAEHVVPHVPQLDSSLCRSTHAPEHTSGCAAGQVQVPERHHAPVAHALPQLPQFVVLVLVLTHAPPQTD